MGAAIAKAGAERATPLATATLVVAANAPDVDILSFARGEYFALYFRRGITHGWPAMLVLPLAVTGVMLAWDRWVRRGRDPDARPADARRLLALSVVGILTHPVLDWMNIYGMRWWMPLDDAWSYRDSLFIIDPWLWLALGGSVFLASAPGRRGLLGWAALAILCTALVVLGAGGWMAVAWTVALASVVTVRMRRGAGGSGRRRGAVRAVGAACVLYVALMTVSDVLARADVVETATRSGYDVEAVLVAPAPGVPFRANVELLADGAWTPGDHDWLASPRLRLSPEAAIPVLDVPEGMAPEVVREIVDEARADADAAHFLAWARFTYVRVRPDSGGWRVRFADVRYDSDPEAGNLGGVSVHVRRAQRP